MRVHEVKLFWTLSLTLVYATQSTRKYGRLFYLNFQATCCYYTSGVVIRILLQNLKSLGYFLNHCNQFWTTKLQSFQSNDKSTEKNRQPPTPKFHLLAICLLRCIMSDVLFTRMWHIIVADLWILTKADVIIAL